MKDPYYTTYQTRDWTALQAVKGAIESLQKKRNVFLDCGLKDAADRVMAEITDNLREQERLTKKMDGDRKMLARELVKVFLVAYLAYAKALDFEDLVKRLTGATEDALSDDMKEMVKACERLGLMIDRASGNNRQVALFGTMTDKLEDWFRDKMENELETIINDNANFEKLF